MRFIQPHLKELCEREPDSLEPSEEAPGMIDGNQFVTII